jgi:A/G-specific adenine glycosylase
MLKCFSSSDKIEEFRKKIIEWYEVYGDKHLPWRNTSNGWAVLIASFLLRKTTTTQVARIYEEFLERFPNPQAILSAGEEEVRRLIKPLGIEHQRAKCLIKLAKELVRRFGGQVPCSKEELMKLPGVGDYTASEVLLVTYSKPEPLLDRNMIRVIERVLGVKSTKKRPHTDRELWLFAKSLVPEDPEKARKFNFGVLDFARKICTAREPRCIICPVKGICQWFSAC